MTLDRETRKAIAQAVASAIVQRQEMEAEKWVTAEELCSHFAMFTKDWLRRYGWKLPRERVEYEGDDGKQHVTRWGYPLHEIQAMLRTNNYNIK